MADKERMTNEKQSAYEAIKEFTDLSEQNLQMIGQLSSNSGVFDIYNTENSFFYVNSNLKTVEGAVFLESPEQSKIVRLTQRDAEKIARQFAIDHYDTYTLKNFKLINALLIDHGDGGKEYLFVWREFIESTGTPNIVRISVNPESGKIISYLGQQRDIEVSITPNISKERAVDKAISCFPKATINLESVSAYLSIEYITPGNQVLTWIVTIEYDMKKIGEIDMIDAIDRGIVIINAHTGEILFIDNWQ
jgi:hypothetical protein